ncbi:hypothetical protein QP166_15550 [Sphingomonas sp. LR60]|uniref:hypothetical protein n=1 Tax=Sphingomonas sp. LR60 TaxID=3050233 RepID=UPI002FE26951
MAGTGPRLHALLTRVREALADGDAEVRAQAIADLTRAADDLAAAPDTIRAGVADASFTDQSRPWLDALALWGRALQQTAAGLAAADASSPAASRYFTDAQRLASEAAAVKTIPGATRFDGTIHIADGVLDRFVADAPGLIARP